MSTRKRQRISPVSLKGLAFLAIAILGPLVALEILIRLFWNQSKDNVTYVGPRLVLTEEGYHRYLPGARWQGRIPEFTIDYTISSQGFRDQVIHQKDRESMDAPKHRFLVLGDSFTVGVGSAYEDTFLHRLETHFQSTPNGASFIKAGIEGYNQYLEYHYLTEIYDDFPSDYVMVCFLPNDLFDNRPLDWTYEISSMPALVTTPKRDFELHMLQASKALVLNVDALYVTLYEKTGRGRLFTVGEFTKDSVNEQLSITQQLFSSLHDYCLNKGAKLIVVSIPQLYQVLKETDDAYDPFKLDTFFAAFARDEGFEWIETLSAFRKAAQEDGIRTHYRVDGHLTPAGNEVLATHLRKPLASILNADPTE